MVHGRAGGLLNYVAKARLEQEEEQEDEAEGVALEQRKLPHGAECAQQQCSHRTLHRQRFLI